MELNTKEIYHVVLKEYPDVMAVKEVSKVLSVSTKTVYKLLNQGVITSLKVGREFRVPKVYLMQYIKVFGSSICEQPTT